jgi:hypothetical protein
VSGSARRDARLAVARAALEAARCDLAALEALRAERTRALAIVDSLPSPVRAATPAQKHADEVASDLAAISDRVMLAHQRVAMSERDCMAAEMEKLATTEPVVIAVDPTPLDTRNVRRYVGEFRWVSRAKVEVAVARSTRWLEIAELFVAPRIAREEIGDLLEIIHRLEREGRPAWHIYVRAITGMFFAFWHSWGEKIAALKKIGG